MIKLLRRLHWLHTWDNWRVMTKAPWKQSKTCSVCNKIISRFI